MQPPRFRRNQRTAMTLAGFVFLVSATIAYTCLVSLAPSTHRNGCVMICLIGGLAFSAIVFVVISKLPDRQSYRIAAVILLVIVFIGLPGWSCYAKRITYARFGFSVYGAIPIPALDFAIDRYGVLRPRFKSHRIERGEIERLLTADVEIVVVGVGWDSIARLTKEAAALANKIDLRVHPTPQAFEIYNELRSSGRRVVLLAHTTC